MASPSRSRATKRKRSKPYWGARKIRELLVRRLDGDIKVPAKSTIHAVPGTDQYRRSPANCFIEGEDVSKWVVRSGWALSFVRYSHAYDSDEVAARDAHAGLWSGAFIAPWDWRHRNKSTIILGAASVPINAQTLLLSAVSASDAPSPECVIKGNVNRKGERIYHLPGQLNYAQINMTKGLGERWFCTEAEADAGGWREAVR